MAASLMNILDDLEMRLERTQAELQALREENQRLKQQLAQNAQGQGVPSSEPGTSADTERHSEAAVEAAAVETDPADTALEEKGESSIRTETVKAPSPHALLNQWYERYPKAFFKGHTKPLKIGIHQELAEREEWSNKLIRRALANYVNLPRYIKAVREGVERVDLDGQPAGKVDKEAALHASEKRGDQKEKRGDQQAKRGDQKRAEQPKKVQADSALGAEKTRVEDPEPRAEEKVQPHKPLSMEDKLLGLQQKFKGR